MRNESTVALLALLGAFLLIPVLAALEGWALTETWRLLLIPAAMDYAGMEIKPLSIGVAIAVAFTIRQFVSSSQSSSGNNKEQSYAAIFGGSLAKPFATVLFAWILALFI
jgi:hypothetical protein